MLKAKNSLQAAWEKLNSTLYQKPEVVESKERYHRSARSWYHSYLADASLPSNASSKKANRFEILSRSVNISRRDRSTSTSRSVQQTLSTSFDNVVDDEVHLHPLLEIRRVDNQLFLRSIPISTLVHLYLSKCRDNEILPTKKKCAAFITQMNKRTIRRVLDLRDQALGINGSVAVAQLICNDSHFLKLILLGNHFTENGWTLFAEQISNQPNTTLLHIDISHCSISPSGSAKVLSALKHIISLVSLNISHNHLSMVGCEAMRVLLQSLSTLQYLDLSSTQMGQGFQAVCHGLVEANSLLCLVLSNNELEHTAIHSLAQSLYGQHKNTADFMIELNLERNNIGRRGADEISTMLRFHDWKLQKLNLSRTHLNTFAFTKIGDSLVQHPFIEYLNLSHNNFSDHGLDCMMHMLSHNSTLRYLHLSDCFINALGAYMISEGLLKNRWLSILDLSGNPIQNKGAELIARSLHHHRSLASLDISRCSLRDEGASYFFVQLIGNLTLFSLNVKSNFMTDLSLALLRDLILSSKIITEVDYSLNLVNHRLDCELQEAIRSNQTFQKEQLVPKFKQKLQALDGIQKQKEELQHLEEHLKEAEKLVESQFDQTRDAFNLVKNEEKMKWSLLEKKNESKNEKLISLQKLNDQHDIEQYRWRKNFEADLSFYHKNIQDETKMYEYYRQAINVIKHRHKLLSSDMPRRVHELQLQLTAAKSKMEEVQCVYEIKRIQYEKKLNDLNKQDDIDRRVTLQGLSNTVSVPRKSMAVVPKRRNSIIQMTASLKQTKGKQRGKSK